MKTKKGTKKNNFLKYDYEKSLEKKGFSFICGVDEAGRGPWAGPITACAVRIRNYELKIKDLGINDSKKLTEKKRERIFDELVKSNNVKYNVTWIGVEEIDKIGLGVANQLVLKRAVEGLKTKLDYVLVDGYVIEGLDVKHERVIKGDEKIFSIAIASVIAKVNRDRYMRQLAVKYPRYGFEKHKGYGTKLHQEMIKKYGICPEHRKSFKPIIKILKIKNKI